MAPATPAASGSASAGGEWKCASVNARTAAVAIVVLDIGVPLARGRPRAASAGSNGL